MKPKNYLLCTFIFAAIITNAQFTKGTRMAGATIGTGVVASGKTAYSFPNNTSSTAYQNSSSISITPSLGWFLNDEMVWGATLLFNSSHNKTWREGANGNTYRKDKNRNTDFGIGGFFRYYLKNTGSLLPFAHAFVSGGSGITKTDGFFYEQNYSQTYEGKSSDRFFYNAGLNLGVGRMIGTGAALEGFIGYMHSYNKFTTTTKVYTDNGGLITTSDYVPTQTYSGNGISFGIGFQVFL